MVASLRSSVPWTIGSAFRAMAACFCLAVISALQVQFSKSKSRESDELTYQMHEVSGTAVPAVLSYLKLLDWEFCLLAQIVTCHPCLWTHGSLEFYWIELRILVGEHLISTRVPLYCNIDRSSGESVGGKHFVSEIAMTWMNEQHMACDPNFTFLSSSRIVTCMYMFAMTVVTSTQIIVLEKEHKLKHRTFCHK